MEAQLYAKKKNRSTLKDMSRNHSAMHGDKFASQKKQCVASGMGKSASKWAPLLYLELGLNPTSKRNKLAPRLSMRREVFGWLIAARSRHRQFAAYHQKILPRRRIRLVISLWEISCPTPSFWLLQTQNRTELCYGRKKLDELYP